MRTRRDKNDLRRLAEYYATTSIFRMKAEDNPNYPEHLKILADAMHERLTRGNRDAIQAAKKKLPLLPESELRRNLHMAGMSEDAVEAYRIGAEEAQREIVARLQELGD